MNKLLLSIFFMTIISFVACNDGKKETVEAKEEIAEINSIPTEKKILSVEKYRLDNIQGNFGMHGGTYGYDAIQNVWCERPMAADIMSYMKMNDIENIEDVPDLNTYFDQKTTNDFNSCNIKITDYGDFKDISLHYKGKLIYQNSINGGEKKDLFQNFKVKKLNNFDLPLVGTIDYSNGENYIITITGAKATIVFTNEFGEYEMELLKIRKNNVVVSSQGVASVVSDRAYFHTEPDFTTRRKAFVVSGEQVRYSKLSGNFVFVVFFNTAGTKTEGWLLKSDLAF